MTERRARYKAGRSKYNNKKCHADGFEFDSLDERERYYQLVLLQRAGNITDLVVHPKYELAPKFRRKNGEAVRAITYEGDFEYVENGVIVVEDVKGFRTEVFNIKEKLFFAAYPDHDLRIIKM